MRLFDFIILAAVASLALGVYLLFCKGGGGGGGGSPTVSPSSRFPGGGWQPGFVSTQVRNGGTGGSTPIVNVGNQASWN